MGAGVSNAAKIIRGGGGFEAETDAPLMIAQIQLDGKDLAVFRGSEVDSMIKFHEFMGGNSY